MQGHLLRCRSALRAHVRPVMLLRQASGTYRRQRHRTAQCAFRVQGFPPPRIWPSLNTGSNRRDSNGLVTRRRGGRRIRRVGL